MSTISRKNKKFANRKRNALTYNIYYSFFKNVMLNLFKWEGLPNNIPSRFIEKVLFNNGICGIAANKSVGVIACNISPIGNKNICKCKYEATLHLNIDNKHTASIYINDGIKENVANMISNLKSSGIKTYMFTGDKKETAIDIGKKIGIDEIKYEMLPTDKYENYEKIANKNEITIFVGDGVNDAPTLKRADIGISMGNVGTDASIEASDVVLMNDDVDKIPLAIDISKYTKYIIKQNLVFAIVVKLAILLLSVFGYANMWLAVFADTGVTLLTILNTLRIIKRFK